MNDEFLQMVRQAVADYMRSEGCSCCRDTDAHEVNAKRLAELLNVPMYSDGSGYNFALFRSGEQANNACTQTGGTVAPTESI